MIEYLRSDNSELLIDYKTVHSATGVTFEIYDIDTDEFIQAGTAPLTASFNPPSSSTTWTARLTEESAAYDRNIQIEWIRTTASGATSAIEYATLARPFVTASRIRSLANIDATVTDQTLVSLERKARYFLQSHIGISFTKEYTAVVVYGNNSDVLQLPIPVIQIDKVYEDDVLIYDSTVNPVLNSIDYNIGKSLSRNRIRIIGTDSDFDRGIMEFPDVHVLPYNGVFRKDVEYRVVGIFGYTYVPSKIEQATALLVEDYLCNDSNIRNKNIEKISNDSYDISYSPTAAMGTGNLVVDKLISEWLNSPRFLVI